MIRIRLKIEFYAFLVWTGRISGSTRKVWWRYIAGIVHGTESFVRLAVNKKTLNELTQKCNIIFFSFIKARPHHSQQKNISLVLSDALPLVSSQSNTIKLLQPVENANLHVNFSPSLTIRAKFVWCCMLDCCNDGWSKCSINEHVRRADKPFNYSPR